MAERPTLKTLGELKHAGYRSRSVREEIRLNLLAKLRAGKRLFPGLHGYDDTVIPAIENALLCGQDLLFLGERGQGKSRLDPRADRRCSTSGCPEVAGQRVHDDPFAPVSALRQGAGGASTATPPRSTGSTATTATARSWRRPTCRPPT